MKGVIKMKAKQTIKFPCGLENSVDVKAGIFDFEVYTIKDTPDECPLHGKNCPPKKK